MTIQHDKTMHDQIKCSTRYLPVDACLVSTGLKMSSLTKSRRIPWLTYYLTTQVTVVSVCLHFI